MNCSSDSGARLILVGRVFVLPGIYFLNLFFHFIFLPFQKHVTIKVYCHMSEVISRFLAMVS